MLCSYLDVTAIAHYGMLRIAGHLACAIEDTKNFLQSYYRITFNPFVKSYFY